MADINPTDMNPFEEDTRQALLLSAKWLAENSASLAKSFAGGCRDWSIEFTSGQEGIFPDVRVSVCKVDRDVIEAYNGVRNAISEEEQRRQVEKMVSDWFGEDVHVEQQR